MAGRLDGKVAVVTGGASGIGRAIVDAFLAQGAQVVVADISGDQEAVAKALGPNASAFQVDVTSSAAVKGMLDHAVSTFGQLDILCNNAGLDGALGQIVDYDEDEFDRVVAVNLKGVFLGIRHAIPLMRERGGAGKRVSDATRQLYFKGQPLAERAPIRLARLAGRR